jgi:glycosyltransferase involved in cell wall biosynthesis
MKICFVNNAKLCSGAEEHLLDLGKWLREHDVEPVFLTRETSIFKERAIRDRFKVHPVFTDGAKKLLSVYRLVKPILKEKPDVISVNREHSIFPTYFALKLVLPYLRHKPKIVAVFHTPTGRCYPVLKNFDGIICTSEYTANSFIKSNPAISGKIRIIHYGIELCDADSGEKFEKDRKRRFFKDRCFPIIGMTGELWKNQEELVDAAVHLRKAFPDITLAIVGGGSEEQFERIRESICSKGLEGNFILTGKVDRRLIPDILFDLDLSLSTHRNEGFGIVHIESLASRTPVVAYNSGGLVEIITKGGGILVNGTTEDLAKAVASLLSDDDKRFTLGREGRKVVEQNFSLEKMSLDHLNYYQNMVSQKNN